MNEHTYDLQDYENKLLDFGNIIQNGGGGGGMGSGYISCGWGNLI